MPAHPDLCAAFAAGLASGTLPPGLTATAPDEAARRFAVYRNTVAVGLADALSKRFPVIERLVGPEYFRAMARVYLEGNRPNSPVLLEWGDTFPAFLASFPPLAAHPYMADVARIELARGRAFHAADAAPLTPQQLVTAAANPAAARIGLHPSLQFLHLSSPAVSIWHANQPGAASILTHTGPEIALILRDRRLAVPVAALGTGDAALIGALMQGRSLLSAARLAAVAAPAHDPQPILVRLMEAGAVTLPKETR